MTIPNDSFVKDLQKGITVEDLVLQRIQKKYPNAYRINGYCKEYDLWIPEIAEGVEVKYDPMSNKTGNIVIEVEMFGKPSALSTTKATQWIFYDDNIMMCITPENIKQCIADHEVPKREFTGRGDTQPKKAYLVKKDILYQYGKEI